MLCDLNYHTTTPTSSALQMCSSQTLQHLGREGEQGERGEEKGQQRENKSPADHTIRSGCIGQHK